MGAWNPADIPALHGRVAIVTGASAGLGLAVTRMLVEHGARVVMACRNPTKADGARTAGGIDDQLATIQPLDLADQASVTAFTDAFRDQHERLDLLVNNAGLSATNPPKTTDGFEAHFGVNHLGHLALTLRLLPLLVDTPDARVVTVTSNAYRGARIHPDDPNLVGSGRAYGQSKLANLLFAIELGRRLAAAGHTTRSLAAEPGVVRTEIGTKDNDPAMPTWARILPQVVPYVLPTQSPDNGARSILRAATDPNARSGQLYAPRWVLVGPPLPTTPASRALDPELATRLWRRSLELLSLPEPRQLIPTTPSGR